MKLDELSRYKVDNIALKFQILNLKSMALQSELNRLYLEREAIIKEFKIKNNISESSEVDFDLDTGEVIITEKKEKTENADNSL